MEEISLYWRFSAMMVGTLAACGSGTKEKAEASDSTTLQMYQIGDKPENFDQLMDIANKRIEEIKIESTKSISTTSVGAITRRK